MSPNYTQSRTGVSNLTAGANDTPPSPGGCAPEESVIYSRREIKKMREILVSIHRAHTSWETGIARLTEYLNR